MKRKDPDADRNKKLTRRKMLQGSLAAAAAVTSMGGVTDALLAEPIDPASSPAAADAKKTAARAIDIHAHYFPQEYFDLFNTEGQRYNAEFRMTEKGFTFKTPTESSGPLSARFIDLKQRLADMDAQGVAVHALSLTGPDGLLGRRRILAQAGHDLERRRSRRAQSSPGKIRGAGHASHARSRPRRGRVESRQQTFRRAWRLHGHKH